LSIDQQQKKKERRITPAPRDRAGLPPSASSPALSPGFRQRLWPSGPAHLQHVPRDLEGIDLQRSNFFCPDPIEDKTIKKKEVCALAEPQTWLCG
jgi:hypothetical protein